MAASKFASRYRRLVCAARGHDWKRGTPLHGHDWCQRCRRYDDAPGMSVGRDRWFVFQSWCPVWLKLTKTYASLRVGWAWKPFTAHVSFNVHWGWDRHGELPGLGASLGLWRLRISAGIGQGWQDEDGEDRGFFYVQARFVTYGLRYIACWLGHDMRDPDYGYVSCRRCEHSEEAGIELPEETVAA